MGLSIVLISACESVWIMKASSAVLCCVALFAVAFGSIEDVTPSVLEETSIYHPAANNKVVDAFMGEFAEFDQEEEQLMDVSELSTSLSAKEKKDVWKSYREYTPFGKKGHALAKTNSKGFKAASAKCRKITNAAQRQCSKHFCHARKVCGVPCQKRILEPPRMVIPLNRNPADRTSPLWYRNNEVIHKEQHAKEQKTKELTYKSNRAKKEVAKERKAKEGEAKEEVNKEKQAKAVQRKEHAAKTKAAQKLGAKVRENDTKETQHKEKTNKKCRKSADKVLGECNVQEKKAKKAAKAEKSAKEIETKSKKRAADDNASYKAALAAQKKEAAKKAKEKKDKEEKKTKEDDK